MGIKKNWYFYFKFREFQIMKPEFNNMENDLGLIINQMSILIKDFEELQAKQTEINANLEYCVPCKCVMFTLFIYTIMSIYFHMSIIYN